MSDLLFPEHNRMSLIKEEADVIAAFLEWMEVQGWFIAEYNAEFHSRPIRTGDSIEDVLAKYFDIDLNKIADEKDQLLEKIRTS